jgi:transposase InsO family protein/transposase
MKLHANAALSLNKRRVLVERVLEREWTLTKAAEAAEVSVRCARKWVGRYLAEGEAGLLDRSSAPHRQPTRTDEQRVLAIAALRRLRFTGPEIAEVLGMALSTVSGILTRIGMGKLGRLGLEPAVRYERQRPGELLHIDVKKLGRIERGAGHRVTGKRRYNPTTTKHGGIRRGLVRWEFVHIAIDDCTRMAYAEVLSDEKATTAIGFLARAIAFFERHGMTVEQLLTDNGSAYRSTVHAIACRALGIRHLRTRPRRPQTNGKAERFIRTMLGGWAYGAIYRNSSERTAALDGWLYHYNHHRRHSALGHKPPIARLNERTNLLGTYT